MADDVLDPILNPQQLHEFAVSAYRTKYGTDPTDQQLQNLGSAVGYTQGTSLRRSQATSLLNSPQALAGVNGQPYGNDAGANPSPAMPSSPPSQPPSPPTPTGATPYGNDGRAQPSPGGVGTGSGDLLNPQQLHDFAVQAYRARFGGDPSDAQLRALGTATNYTQGTSLSLADATRRINTPEAYNAVYNLRSQPPPNGGYVAPSPTPPPSPFPPPSPNPNRYGTGQPPPRVMDTPAPSPYGTGQPTPRVSDNPTDTSAPSPTGDPYTWSTTTPTTNSRNRFSPAGAHEGDPNPTPDDTGLSTLQAPSQTPPTGAPPPTGVLATINQFFVNALGRPGTPQELNQWGTDIDGTYLTKIRDAIYNSPEALAYRTSLARQQDPSNPNLPQPSGGPITPPQQTTSRPSTATDQNALISYLQQWAQSHPDANPSVGRDPGYWAGAIARTHGSGAIDWGYWETRFMTPEGAPEGSGTGGNQPPGGGGGNAPPGGGWGGGGGVPPPTGFADPAYQGLIDLVNQRLNNLNQPRSFPQLDSYMQMLQQQEARTRQRAQDFATQLQSRIGQLQQPLLTDANVANQRALASNSLLAQRDATLKNQRERRFAAGFEPTSGLLAGDERSTNESYNNRQASIDAQLQAQQIAGDENRRNQAVNLQGLASQALQGGDLGALQNAATLSDLENQQFNLEQNRQREMLTTGQIPVDLTNMGFTNANTVANGGGDPLNSILQLIQLGNAQQGLQQNTSNSNWGALALLLQQLGR